MTKLSKNKAPKTFDYNVIVLGAGSGGLVAAYIAAAVKARVLLIEAERMGGDCLNTGCVPSKALIRSAKYARELKNGERYGFTNVSGEVDFRAVMDRVREIITTIEPHDSVERYQSLGVECVTGYGKIVDPWHVEVDEQRYSARSIIVASGAAPMIPPITGLETVQYLTSDTLWDLRELPKRFVILGGGPIGCEMAQAFARLGSKVTQVEMQPTLMGREDAEVAECVAQALRDDGVDIRLGAKAVEVRAAGNGGELVVESQVDGRQVIAFDQILVAVGRKARVDGFGLAELGVELTARKTIATNPFMRTNIPSIFAVGDVVGPYQFTHAAAHQAWYAAVNALFTPFKQFKVDYRVLPWVTFTAPEIARVGLNESDAKEQQISYEVSHYDLRELDRAITDGAATGWVKVLTAPNKDRILGVTIVGANAGELIAEFTLAMRYNLGLNKILGTVHSYPTWAEANKYTAGVWKKNNAPQTVLRWIEKLHDWRRG